VNARRIFSGGSALDRRFDGPAPRALGADGCG